MNNGEHLLKTNCDPLLDDLDNQQISERIQRMCSTLSLMRNRLPNNGEKLRSTIRQLLDELDHRKRVKSRKESERGVWDIQSEAAESPGLGLPFSATVAHEKGAAKEVKAEEGVQFFTAMKPQVAVDSACRAEEAVRFYKAAFGAVEVSRTTYRKGNPPHGSPINFCAELKIGGFGFLVCEHVDHHKAVNGAVAFRLETDDVIGAMMKVLSTGAEVTLNISKDGEGCCAGGVVGKVKDPFCVVWNIVSIGNKRRGEPLAARS